MSPLHPSRTHQRLDKMHFCHWNSLWGVPPPHLSHHLFQQHIRSYLFFTSTCRLLGAIFYFQGLPTISLTVDTWICQGVTPISMVSRIHHHLLWQGSQYLFLLNHLVFFSSPLFLQDNYFGAEIIAFSAKDSSYLPSSYDRDHSREWSLLWRDQGWRPSPSPGCNSTLLPSQSKAQRRCGPPAGQRDPTVRG